MNALYYLLEANLYLAVFYGFYRLFLHKETFYILNRYFLISSAIVAFALPLLQFGYLYNLIGLHTNVASDTVVNSEIRSQQDFTPGVLVVYMYMAVAAAYLSKLLLNLYQIIARSSQAVKLRNGEVIYIELEGSETAFSFFNLLFINPDSKDKDTIIRHEMVHIRQKHSADIIFFEIIQILSWFNPIAYLIKKDIKLLHEYIADDATIHTIQKHEYAMLLIQNSFGVIPGQLTNQMFNQSILKMRINMLNKEKSAGRARLKILLVAPIIGGMLCTSTMAFTKDYATVDLYPEKYAPGRTSDQDTLKKAKTANKPAKTVIKGQRTPPPPPTVKTVKFDAQGRLVEPPPPIGSKPAKRDQVKFPPPIVKDAQGRIVEPPPPVGSKPAKRDQVKFPPPIVTPDNKPVKSKPNRPKTDQVKFPPPIVTPDNKPIKSKSNRPKTDQVKFPPPIVKPDVKQKEVPPPPPVEPTAEN